MCDLHGTLDILEEGQIIGYEAVFLLTFCLCTVGKLEDA